MVFVKWSVKRTCTSSPPGASKDKTPNARAERDAMSLNVFRKAQWTRSIVAAAAGLALSALPVAAQHMAGHSTPGTMTTPRPMSNRSFNAPIGIGRRSGAIHPRSSSSAPPPSWELPRTPIPHWEIGPNVRIHPNPVQGNRIFHHRRRFGVGFVGIPVYASPFNFGNAWDWNDDSDYEQQAAPAAQARPEYMSQPASYAEAPYDQEYPPPARAPYNPEAYPPPQQQPSTSAQSGTGQSEIQTDGLDHPAITLVFRDGRPPEKVRSYALTGSSIFVAEPGHQRKIPVADLDLPATIEQNRQAGVDFQLPGNSK
jgi:hypothetical protein